MGYIKRMNSKVREVGFTAVGQRPIREGHENLALLSLTDQRTRRGYPGVRITARADSMPRGYQEKDVYRMAALVEYANEISEQAKVVVAKNLKDQTPVAIHDAELVLREAVEEIAAKFEARGDLANLEWWRAEKGELLPN